MPSKLAYQEQPDTAKKKKKKKKNFFFCFFFCFFSKAFSNIFIYGKMNARDVMTLFPKQTLEFM